MADRQFRTGYSVISAATEADALHEPDALKSRNS
jgi:hypothetical protein